MSAGAIEDDGGSVIGTGSVLGCRERAQPLAGSLAWLPDLRYPFSPAPLPHTSVPELVVIWPSFAFTFPAAVAAITIIIRSSIGAVGILSSSSSGSGDGGFSGKVIRLGCTVHMEIEKGGV